MPNLSRRSVLGLPLAALVPAGALADGPPGRIAAPEVAALLDGMARIDDGDPSRPRIRVIFSPGCAHSLAMFEATRAHRMEAAWRWIPYGGSEKGQATCAAALAGGDMAALELALRGGFAAGGDIGAMRAQDAIIARRAGRLLWDATGSALGTPTQVYRRADGLFMAARGSLPPAALAAMLAAAA